MKRFILVVFFITIVSCNNQNNYMKSANLSIKDSLLEMYLKFADSTPWINTNDNQFQILVSYSKNNIENLKFLIQEDQSFFNNSLTILGPNCPKPASIDAYNFDTAYRFKYNVARCNQVVIFTIGRRNDSFILISQDYKMVYNTDSCVTFKNCNKIISLKEWNIIKKGIIKADLWGLKRENGRYGSDGSNLYVIGYEKPLNDEKGHYTFIYRWVAEKTALGELFGNIIQISNVQVPCFNTN